jgi:hypothetical protein
MKIIRLRFWQFAAIATLAATTGCAATYHDYPDGCVPCAYCAPPPLPYATYEVCLTPIAACYHGKGQDPKLFESVVPIENRPREAASE